MLITLPISENTISIKDNFFDLGGNSILIVRLKSKIEQFFNINDIRVSDLFKYPSIYSLSKFLFSNDTDNDNNKIAQIIEKSTKTISTNIAIIGLSGEFSGSEDIKSFWKNIIEGKESIDTLTKEECEKSRVPLSILDNPNYIPTSGRLKNIDKFDPRFWNISENDAKLFDPQIRKFLEHSWVALEKSGHIKDRQEKNIGVFEGASASQYMTLHLYNKNTGSSNWEIENMNGKDFLSTRISYLLGLTGTSLNINTACSTSLVAIVEACKNLANYSCDVAIAGGVSILMPENHGYIFEESMIFSRDGHCKVFDKEASGIVAGSGVGVVVLKRLQDAVKDKDNIIAVIKGYATNNDGNRKVGYTAPSVIGQAECILQAQKVAKVNSDDIGYVECHGTGTVLGDPIEIASLQNAFEVNSRRGYDCYIGSVKANIGHADAAAGVAGMIKICKMLQDKTIPPQINYTSPSPDLNLKNTNFKITTKRLDWVKSDGLRLASVSSFGIGGTNAHVIVEEYNNIKEKDFNNDNVYILPISAKSINSNLMLCKELEKYG